MKSAPDFRPILTYLGRLSKNNTKQWFDRNRAEYQAVMDAFGSFVGGLITEVGRKEDLEGITPKDCIMRIFRDVRFSKDKSPYRTELGAGIIPGGRTSGRLGYHVRVAPNGASMVAGGLYDPTPQQLSRFRDAIIRDAGRFKAILGSASFRKHFGSLWGESLKTSPKGYDRDHPEIGLLKRKQICAVQAFSDKEVLSTGFQKHVVESMRAMKPFIDYLNEVAI